MRHVVFIALLALGCGPEVVRSPGAPPAEDAGADACVPPDVSPPTCSEPGPCAVATPDRDGGCAFDLVPGCAVCADASCASGTSRSGGACCVGCWAGSTCRPEPSDTACGIGGSLCVPCNGAEACVGGVCVLGPRP